MINYTKGINATKKQIFEFSANEVQEPFYETVLFPGYPKLAVQQHITYEKVPSSNCTTVLKTIADYTCLSFNNKTNKMNTDS